MVGLKHHSKLYILSYKLLFVVYEDLMYFLCFSNLRSVKLPELHGEIDLTTGAIFCYVAV